MTAPDGGALTVVMYHYVRPIAGSRHPNIKGLELAAFEGQLDYLQRHHAFVTARQIIDSVRGGPALPPSPVLLTFDDGYRDHRDHVCTALRRRGLSGAFFPPAGTTVERRMLDVNKLHFILATAGDPDDLVAVIESRVDEQRDTLGLDSLASYQARYRIANRFDTASVVYVKRMLQRALPVALRRELADELFHHFVTDDERAFVDELYLDIDDLREMAAEGMDIGSHGDAHEWLDSLDAEAQRRDVERSLTMLDDAGVPRRDFLFCYPYGAYDENTLRILEANGCGAAFTTRVGLASPTPGQLLTIPRLDTNDLPTAADAPLSEWTRRALEGSAIETGDSAT